ncbi:MAG: hypothetical protein ACC655_10750, partial [Rhodothermia bacterium]
FIGDTLTVDGRTQPGSDCETKALKIILDGQGAPGDIGLEVRADNSSIRGMVIHSFNDGLNFKFGKNNTIQCNIVGTDLAGSTGLGNEFGIRLAGERFTLVGTDADGNGDLGEGNIISGNLHSGITLQAGAGVGSDNTIAGNLIGVKADGTTPLPNLTDGIEILSFGLQLPGDLIGGLLSARRNVIAHNGGAGVRIDGVNNSVLGNSIFSNAGLGIDLVPAGVTANDSDDPDTGANNLQNFPVIATAIQSPSKLELIFLVDSDPTNAAYPIRVEFFVADADSQEGMTFLFSQTYTAGSWGNCGSPPCARFAILFADFPAIGDLIVATATDADGNTSEFSAPVEVTAAFCPEPFYLRAFLEGPYSAVDDKMNTYLADGGVIPLSQPFSDPAFNGTDLEFDGDVSVAAVPDSAVDWVLVSARTGTAANTDVGILLPVFIYENGTIAPAGQDSLCLGGEGGSLYLVVRSRNHLDIMSSSPVNIEGGSWDFTTAATQAFGSDAQKELETGVFGMFASDGSADGQVTANDFNLWLNDTKAVATGYLLSDYNLDTQVIANDFNLWLVNTKAVSTSKVP